MITENEFIWNKKEKYLFKFRGEDYLVKYIPKEKRVLVKGIGIIEENYKEIFEKRDHLCSVKGFNTEIEECPGCNEKSLKDGILNLVEKDLSEKGLIKRMETITKTL